MRCAVHLCLTRLPVFRQRRLLNGVLVGVQQVGDTLRPSLAIQKRCSSPSSSMPSHLAYSRVSATGSSLKGPSTARGVMHTVLSGLIVLVYCLFENDTFPCWCRHDLTAADDYCGASSYSTLRLAAVRSSVPLISANPRPFSSQMNAHLLMNFMRIWQLVLSSTDLDS